VSRFGATTEQSDTNLLRRIGLEGAENIRQLGGTWRWDSLFAPQIDGAVLATLRTDAPLPDSRRPGGIRHPVLHGPLSSRAIFYRRAPENLGENHLRAYVEGWRCFATRVKKERALKAIARYTRLRKQNR